MKPRRAGADRRGEPRAPAAVATVVAIALYALLSTTLIVGPRLVIPILELALLAALIQLLRELATTGNGRSGTLLLAAGQVWLTNVIVFGLAYWELDRGGPVARTSLRRGDLPRADFRFTQDEDWDTVAEVKAGSSVVSDWVPSFPDYLYVSLTNSSAFSPTDTMPLSSRVKLLMGLEATAALVTSVLVIAKGVGGLGS